MEEIVDDVIYFGISAFLSFLAVFIFDVHRSFYNWPIFPLKFIFKSRVPYLIGTLAGGILGLILIKLFIFALQEGTFKKLQKFLKK